jgi:hypothetical protein
MNRVERRVRDLINPYSTAFASWWCHSGRYWRLPRAITGNKTAARPGLPRPAVPRVGGGVSEGSGSQSSPSFPQAPNPGERVPGLGSAKPIACDATAGSDLGHGGREQDNGSPGRRHSAAPVASSGEPD